MIITKKVFGICEICGCLKSDATTQIFKSRIGTETIKKGIYFESRYSSFASLIAFLEPLKRLILITKSHVNERNSVGVNEPLCCKLFELVRNFQSHISFA